MAINNHKKLGLGLGLISLTLAGSIAFQYLLWQQQQLIQGQQKQELSQTQTQLTNLSTQLETKIQKINQSIQSIAKPRSQIEDLGWLIQQADWQLKFFHQLDLSQHLLKLALNLAQVQDWQVVIQALEADLSQLKLIKLTPSQEIVDLCTKLNKQLSNLSPRTPYQQAQNNEPPLPQYIQIFKPYFQIERYTHAQPQVLTLSRQNQMIEQLKLLLPSMQAAALNHQPVLFQQLLSQFQQTWQALKASQHEPNIDALIQNMQNFQLSYNESIQLRSADAAKNLEYQLFHQAPV